MKMKKYVAPSMPEAMKKVRSELGDDAVILNSKVIHSKGFLGLFKKKSFEVVAGIDRIEQKEPLTIQNQFEQTSSSLQQTEDIKKELGNLKELMHSLQRQSIGMNYPDELLPVVDILQRHDLSQELITQIGDELLEHMKTMKGTISQDLSIELAKKALKKQIEHLPFGGMSYKKKYINLLGPTGVGKTTTIAKMAARAVLEKKQKIGFITTDTYRIAAIEQLKTYANLLQAPVEVVYNANDYKEAIEKFAHLDLVFIDTAGRNYKEVKYVEELKKLVNFNHEMETYLVLSMTAKENDLATIVEKFSTLPIEKFIFTKIDETNSIGSMVNLMIKYNKGLAYYTNGQEVPEDIQEASVELLMSLLFQGEIE